jgi:uncharacterized repeat protein (TIGR03803 family)
MKIYISDLFLLPALIAGLGLIPAGRVTAQTFTTLYSFTAIPQYPGPYTNSDGVNPQAGLILSGSTLFGTAYSGGSSGYGTMFKVNTDGSGFTNLHSFTATSGPYPNTNSDGVNPRAGLISGNSNTLYGTAVYGGSSGNGTIFKVNIDGTGFTNLHSFTKVSGGSSINSDGVNPQAGLILSGNTLYGTANYGGSSGFGTVFALNTDGTGFTTLHSFTATSCYDCPNSDGARPLAGLILSANTLYGTASQGGSSGKGTVFAVKTNGTSFTTLHSFTATLNSTNSDGISPTAGLILSGNTLYGTANYGGSSGFGTVFALNTNGTGFATLHSFTNGSDGANPNAGLILSGSTVYGTAVYGGSSGNGTIFAVNTDGTGFTNLHTFTYSGGTNPYAGLILSANMLYGTAYQGGSSGKGTVFSLSFAPQLAIILSGANVILTWPTNNAGFSYAGFTLQSTTNLVSPAVWTAVLPTPVVVNGQNAVTNPISGPQQFYRLRQ